MYKLFIIFLLFFYGIGNGQIINASKYYTYINVCPISDTNVINFSTAAGITNCVIKQKLQTFVKGLKDSGLWANTQSIFPFIGGTSKSISYNLKDTSTYKLTIYNNPVVNDSAVVLNGTTQYLSTPSNQYYQNSVSNGNTVTCISRQRYYSYPPNIQGNGLLSVARGVDNNSAFFEILTINGSPLIQPYFRVYTSSVNTLYITSSSTSVLNELYNIQCVYDGSKMYVYKNGVKDVNSISATGNITSTLGTGVVNYEAIGTRVNNINTGISAFASQSIYFQMISSKAFTDSQVNYVNDLINNLKN